MKNSAESSFRPAWQMVSSSESEYSDTEGGNRAKLKSMQTKVRVSAFSALFSVIKVGMATAYLGIPQFQDRIINKLNVPSLNIIYFFNQGYR